MRIAVLRGGPSHEYEVSIKTGENVLSILRNRPDKYSPIDVFISKDGTWHLHGRAVPPHKALSHVDVVFNALHGTYGEDGKVQTLLSALNIPYTGSGPVASALAMNKGLAKEVYVRHGLRVPKHEMVEGNVSLDKLIQIFRNYLHPVIVKPVDSGSSVGMRLAHTFEELKEAVVHALRHSERALIEEYILGKEATCAVVDGARGQKLYALIPVEIRKPLGSPFFDYEAKYSGESTELCPGSFSPKENREIENAAKLAHEALGLRHYSRSDFIITPKGNIYILETNSLPGLTKESLLPKSLRAVGWDPHDFVEHVISLAK